MSNNKKKKQTTQKREGGASFASPLATLFLVVALLVIVLAVVVEGDFFATPPPSEPPAQTLPAPSPSAQTPLPPAPGGWQGFEMHTIDVGKADCILLICDGQTMLVDGGEAINEETIFAYLDQMGIQSLDFMINTHPHADHLGSLDAVARAYPTSIAYLSPKPHTTRHYEDFLLALDETNVDVRIPSVGETLAFGGATITFLAPDPNADFGDSINDWSIVFLLEYQGNRFLFTGDAESPAEQAILSTGADIRADVLKVGHHGSNSSSKKSFLDAVSPDVAVITCAEMPNEKVLGRLQERGIQVLRNDLLGSIVIRAGPQGIELPSPQR